MTTIRAIQFSNAAALCADGLPVVTFPTMAAACDAADYAVAEAAREGTLWARGLDEVALEYRV